MSRLHTHNRRRARLTAKRARRLQSAHALDAAILTVAEAAVKKLLEIVRPLPDVGYVGGIVSAPGRVPLIGEVAHPFVMSHRQVELMAEKRLVAVGSDVTVTIHCSPQRSKSR